MEVTTYDHLPNNGLRDLHMKIASGTIIHTLVDTVVITIYQQYVGYFLLSFFKQMLTF